MKTSDFDYNLPENLIAQTQAIPRDHSKLMVVHRDTGKIEHKKFYEILEYFSENDVLVLNNTKVFPARFFGKKDTGGKIETLLVEETDRNIWKALTTPGLKKGQKIFFEDVVFTAIGHREQTVILESSVDKIHLLSVLNSFGVTPLPPYIHSDETESKIREEYQTVYAKILGSVAAPTAGFHFTPKLLQKLKEKGVQIEYVTLHVGLGTFAPVKTEKLEDHPMHFEYFEVEKSTLERLSQLKLRRKKITSVGTTTTRVLETLSRKNGLLDVSKTKGETDLFIYPPYKFNFVDRLITNFHLPKSTLLSLVSAFVSTPNTSYDFVSFQKSLMGKAYKEAVNQEYRFYSFGDSSIII